MKLAIMQPYFLPYLGYFQLLAAVDKFVLFDDVHYINRGWINRNRILLNGKDHLFTIPLKGASQNRRICEIEVADDDRWRDKLLKTIAQAYSRAPQFNVVFPLVEEIVRCGERKLAPFLRNSLARVAAYLDIRTPLEPTSARYANAHLKGEARILDICRQENASGYVNPIGGVELYDQRRFAEAGVALCFLASKGISYPQFDYPHVPSLSIIDVLMFNRVESVQQMLSAFELR